MRSTRLGFFQTSSYDWDGILCDLSMMNSGLPCPQIRLAILFDATTFGWCGTCCDIINGLVKMEHIGPNSRKGRHLSMFWASHVNLRWGPWVLWIWWLPKRKKRILKYIKLVANTNNHLAFIPPLYDFQRNYCNQSHTLTYILESLLCEKSHVSWNGRWEKLLGLSSLHQHIKFLTNPSSTLWCLFFCTSTFITLYQNDQWANLITFGSEVGVLCRCPNIVQIIWECRC